MKSFFSCLVVLALAHTGLCTLLKHSFESTSFALAKSLTVELSESAYVSVKYAPEGASVGPYYTPWQYISSTTEAGSVSGTVEIFRLRSQTTYNVTIYSKTSLTGKASAESTTTFTTSSTGFNFFDNGPYGTIVDGTPTFEILMIDGGFTSDTLSEVSGPPPPPPPPSDDGSSQYAFGGLIALDPEGYVVWYYEDESGVQPWDQLSDGSYNMIAQSDSGLIQFDLYGDEVIEYTPSTCTSYATMQSISHDATINTDDDSYPVLSISTYVTTYNRENLAVDTLISWDRDTNEVTTVYDLYDYFSPSEYWGEQSSGSITEMCGSSSESTYDWTHMNAVSNGNNSTYILSVRSWSAVVAMNQDGSGIDWVMASETPSDFTLVDGIDSDLGADFYNQHNARQLPNGNIIMMDNGNSRSGCSTSGSDCYSRGAEYELDMDAMTATLVWEFNPGMYTSKGGNADVLSNGNRIIAFVAVDDSSASDDFYVFEADSDGNQVAEIHLPACSTDWYAGAYRAVPFDSLFGESSTSTL